MRHQPSSNKLLSGNLARLRIAVCGPPGSGKSTQSQRIATQIGADVLEPPQDARALRGSNDAGAVQVYARALVGLGRAVSQA